MRVLWIVNTIFPYPAEKIGVSKTVFGGWLNALAEALVKESDIELGIATVYSGKNILEIKEDETQIQYYLIPGAPAITYQPKMEEYWKEVKKRFQPDFVHIHGTEYTHGLAYVNANKEDKVITSIQGLISKCAEVYYANIEWKEIVRSTTLGDLLRSKTIFQNKKEFEKRGQTEKALLRKSDIIIGRTYWDYANAKAIVGANQLVYRKHNETLRNSFYQETWNIETIRRKSIFCSQATFPIKGLHYLLKAVGLLKDTIPDIMLYVAGYDITNLKTWKNKLKLNSYGKYLLKLIKEYQIQENVCFTGILTEQQMKEQMLRSNVYVLPSALENSSNSLGEAMLMGVPCIATDVRRNK